jgi:ComF family protein
MNPAARLIDLVFPPLCHGCRLPVPGGEELHLCRPCRERVPAVSSPLCTVCGIPFATEGGIDHRCGDCISAPPPFASARAAGTFDDLLPELIHRFKYEHRTHLRRPLGLLMAERLDRHRRETGAEILVPVPLHRKRLKDRGFNQAVLLGGILSRKWGLPLSPDALCRHRWTEPQIALSAGERPGNVRGAFSVRRPEVVEGRTVMLIDDVCTTGSTLAECARTLLKAGAASVHAVTIARAL